VRTINDCVMLLGKGVTIPSSDSFMEDEAITSHCECDVSEC